MAKDDGAGWAQDRTYIESADLTSAVDASTIPRRGRRIVVDDVLLSADTDMAVTFAEEEGGTHATIYLAANVPVQITTRGKWRNDHTGTKLRVQASTPGNVAITVWHHSEAP